MKGRWTSTDEGSSHNQEKLRAQILGEEERKGKSGQALCQCGARTLIKVLDEVARYLGLEFRYVDELIWPRGLEPLAALLQRLQCTCRARVKSGGTLPPGKALSPPVDFLKDCTWDFGFKSVFSEPNHTSKCD